MKLRLYAAIFAAALTLFAAGATPAFAAAVPHAGPVSASPVSASPARAAAQPNAPVHGFCNSGTLDWFHLYNTYNNVEICVGDRGTWDPNATFTGFCGGNNYGSFYGYNADGVYSNHTFGQGTTIYNFSGNQQEFPGGVFVITSVTINGFSGQDYCPQ